MSDRRARWRASEEADLREAREASDRLTLSERAEEAVALYVMTLSEIARVSTDRDDFVDRISTREPLPSLGERWRRLHPRHE